MTDVPGANIVTKAGSVPYLGRLKTQLKPLQAPGALGSQKAGRKVSYFCLLLLLFPPSLQRRTKVSGSVSEAPSEEAEVPGLCL